LDNFLTHLFTLIFCMLIAGVAILFTGLAWYGALVVWSYIF